MKNETKAKFEPTIGLEIHVQLSTKSKMFCACNNDSDGVSPNTNVCPVCMGFPGTLPVANGEAMRHSMVLANALGCKLNEYVRFDRKNYFYPDLPKGYQITQLDYPTGEDGKVSVGDFAVGITRLHLEEDAGKLIHKKNHSLVDFNRTGTPLVEIVTEPDIKSPAQAREFLKELKRIVRAMDVSSADMEKGHLRVDANISLAPIGSKKLGAKVEVKNLNSFKAVERALNFEIERQTELLNDGKKIAQETRGWDDAQGATLGQRGKEESRDYRYFPEPDLPPFVYTKEKLDRVTKLSPLSPDKLRKTIRDNYKLDNEKTEVLLDKLLTLGVGSREVLMKDLDEQSKNTKRVIGEILSMDGFDLPNARALIWGINAAEEDKISHDAAIKYLVPVLVKKKDISEEMVNKLISELDLGQIRDTGELENTIKKILDKNVDAVKKYRSGKKNVLGFLVGEAMRELKGKANPKEITRILVDLL